MKALQSEAGAVSEFESSKKSEVVEKAIIEMERLSDVTVALQEQGQRGQGRRWLE